MRKCRRYSHHDVICVLHTCLPSLQRFKGLNGNRNAVETEVCAQRSVRDLRLISAYAISAKSLSGAVFHAIVTMRVPRVLSVKFDHQVIPSECHRLPNYSRDCSSKSERERERG